MKNTFAFLFIVTIILSACSSDKRINRQLDGSWYATMYENIIISPQIEYEFHFSKEKKGKGNGYNTLTYPGFTTETHFTYEIDSKIMKYMTKDSSGAVVTAHLNIIEHDKDKMVFKNLGNGNMTTLRAK